MTEKRVCFDFEIDFSNGGGIQGQDFRLDLVGEDIEDDALAAYIISELRLLMVGATRILNKRIIQEPHKRRSLHSEPERNEKTFRQHIDLSHDIVDGMITYKGLPAPLICDHLSHLQSRELYDEGTEFHFGRINMISNTGTYIDAPFHRFSDGCDLTGLKLEQISGVPGVVVRLTGMSERLIDWSAFAATQVKGKAVLIETGWSQNWGTDQYFENHPCLTEKAATYLKEQGALLVGIDSLNIDNTEGGSRPVHTILLGAGIPIVEHMTNLEALPETGFEFFATPPKVRGLGTFPVRAHARLTG